MHIDINIDRQKYAPNRVLNHSLWAKSGALPVLVNKALLEHNYTHLSVWYIELLKYGMKYLFLDTHRKNC